MINIYISQYEEITPVLHKTRDHIMPFEMESNSFRFVFSPTDADIIPVLPHASAEEFQNIINYLGVFDRSKVSILIMLHTHIQDSAFFEKEYQYLFEDWGRYSNNVVLLTVNPNITSKQYLFYDFHWNRQKAYFVDYDNYDLEFRLWTGHATKKMFELTEITRRGPYKKILLPNRVFSCRDDDPRNMFRQKLHDLVPDRYCHRGHPEQGYVLYPQENTKELYDSVATSYGGWSPVSSDYYETSFVSVYVETITGSIYNHTGGLDLGTVKSITEKTYDPLIKGHFILPFGYSGIISDIKKIGFILPDWIDYSYDTILDIDERFKAYCESVLKIINLSDFELLDLYEQDSWMLTHNRNLFFVRPYDSLHKKLKQAFGTIDN
jgi:hypothetical protein